VKLGSKKVLTCNKCGTTGLRWENNGRWVLFDPSVNMFHKCPVDPNKSEVKEVECKYCHVNDLWWSKETMEDGRVIHVLMESYGIPHGCEKRKEHLDKLSQEKKDQYAKGKAEIEAIPDQSPCRTCVHGFVSGLIYNSHPRRGVCWNCGGSGKTTAATKKRMLYELRKKIWPEMMRKK
jgi:hypothetical protein